LNILFDFKNDAKSLAAGAGFNPDGSNKKCRLMLVLDRLPAYVLVRPAGFEPATYGFVVRRSVRAELRAQRNFIEMSLLIKL
jgi:hypothetical protein